MNDENKDKKIDTKSVENLENKAEQPAMRQIIIETNGNDIKLVKAEVAGNLELIAILQAILGSITNKQ